jgi:hypothetical protein
MLHSQGLLINHNSQPNHPTYHIDSYDFKIQSNITFSNSVYDPRLYDWSCHIIVL